MGIDFLDFRGVGYDVFVNGYVLEFLILIKNLLLGRYEDENWESDLCVYVGEGNKWSYEVLNFVF